MIYQEGFVSLDAVGIVSKDINQSIRFYGILGVVFKKISVDHWEENSAKGVRIMLDSVVFDEKIKPELDRA